MLPFLLLSSRVPCNLLDLSVRGGCGNPCPHFLTADTFLLISAQGASRAFRALGDPCLSCGHQSLSLWREQGKPMMSQLDSLFQEFGVWTQRQPVTFSF